MPSQSIGILARLLVHLESHPFVPHLHRTSPTYGTIQCYGAHGKNVPDSQRKLIERSVKSDKALGELEKLYLQNPFIKAQIGTTQAVDLVQGGVKVNALPESAEAVVNHRIATER
jgi:Gly-Xaa carboxypeptidase